MNRLSTFIRRPGGCYSDAVWSVCLDGSRKTGTGGIFFQEDVVSVLGLKECPQLVFSGLGQRDTQLIFLELLAVVGTLHSAGEMLWGKDLISPVDNRSVCAVFVKGASKSADLQACITAWHLDLYKAGCRVWVEYVPTGANPADGISRKLYSSSAKVRRMTLPRWAGRRFSQNLVDILYS